MGMNKEVETLMIVGEVREAMNKMANYLGCDPLIQLPQDALISWQNLEKQYDDFYKLDLQERFYKSGMATKAKE